MRGPGFQFVKNLDGSAYVPSNMYKVGKNGGVFTIGDVVRINTSGFCDVVDANTEAIVGVCTGVVDGDEKAIAPDSGSTNTWTLEDDNQTVDGYKVAFIPALPNYLFYNDTSGDLTATMEFQYFYITSESQVDGSSGTDSHVEQFRLISRDPDGDADASKGLFQIVQSQFAQEAEDTVS